MNKTKWLQIRTNPERHAEISRAARKLGLTVSAYVMLCIEHGHDVVVKQVEGKS